jgi:glycerophosphoryl diester phosphodiesterase
MKTSIAHILIALITLTSSASAQVSAHRGDAEVTPENTIAAIKSAIAKGAQQIEFDVDMTKDGHLVIMHDATVDRTTNGRGKVTRLTFDEIRSLDAGSWFSDKYKGTQVPTLREILEAIPKQIYCNVHLKGNEKVAQESAKLIAEMGRLDTAFLACTTENIKAARQVVPNIKTCNMTRQAGNRALYIKETIALGCEFIQLHQRDGFNNLENEVSLLHENGVIVNWFGANEVELMNRLNRAGVDFILTDKLSLAMKTIGNVTNR